MQTYSPRHYTYKFAANYDYKGFFRKEENIRATAKFPPFTRIIRILFTHQDENVVNQAKDEITTQNNEEIQKNETDKKNENQADNKSDLILGKFKKQNGNRSNKRLE